MTTTIDSLRVQGEPAPKNSEHATPLNTTMRINRPTTHMPSTERTYQFVLNHDDPTCDLTLTGHSHHTVPVRKMEHLSRVRTANFGMSTMDGHFVQPTNFEQETHFVIEKPHFVLCGLPMGSKDIDHHLYVSEARVGNFKTSAKALYQARNGPRSGKASSEPVPFTPINEPTLQNNNNSELDDMNTHRAFPPMPPTTPVNYAYAFNGKPKTAPTKSPRDLQAQRPSYQIGEPRESSGLTVKQRKMVLHRRDECSEGPVNARESSGVSTRSGRSVETVKDSVVNNSLTLTAGRRGKMILAPYVKHVAKVNYNNPYRNTKFKERLALTGNNRMEFNTVDSYLKYQKQQNQNGKLIMTPRAILKIPNPCSDNFLLQMMYELNRPKSRRSGLHSAKYSDIAQTRDLEEFVHERTSSSLSKTQSNIDRFLGRKSGKSIKSRSSKSAKSGLDADPIEEEESSWDGLLNDDRSVEERVLEN